MAFLESQGMQVFWSATTGISTAVEVLQVVAANGPTGSAGKIDVTNLLSTAKEFLMGLRDEGDISFDTIYDPNDAGQASLFADRGTRTKKRLKIEFNDASTSFLDAKGYCTGFAITGAVDDALKATYTIAITGAVSVSTA